LTQVVNKPAAAVACKMSLGRPQAGSVTASLTGTPGQTYVLQATTDMVHWTAISTNTADENGLLTFIDTNAGNYRSRFYRSATLQ